MKIAIAGDSAGEGLAKVLADHLSNKFEVAEISRTGEGPDTVLRQPCRPGGFCCKCRGVRPGDPGLRHWHRRCNVG